MGKTLTKRNITFDRLVRLREGDRTYLISVVQIDDMRFNAYFDTEKGHTFIFGCRDQDVDMLDRTYLELNRYLRDTDRIFTETSDAIRDFYSSIKDGLPDCQVIDRGARMMLALTKLDDAGLSGHYLYSMICNLMGG